MRHNRLWALEDELNEIIKERLEQVRFNFEQAINRRVVRVEKKGDEEAGIRLRQWQQAVQELKETPESAIPYYATAVENRVILADLLAYLQQEPYQFDEKFLADTIIIDQQLSLIWRSGEFIWPALWQSAYPKDTYWWLYGKPTAKP